MIGLTNEVGKVFYLILVNITMNWTGGSLGILVGISASPNVVLAMLPVVLLGTAAFAGIFKHPSDFSDWNRWITYCTPIRYGYMGVVQS